MAGQNKFAKQKKRLHDTKAHTGAGICIGCHRTRAADVQCLQLCAGADVLDVVTRCWHTSGILILNCSRAFSRCRWSWWSKRPDNKHTIHGWDQKYDDAAVDLVAIDLGAIDLVAIDLAALDLAAIDLAAIDLAAVDLAAVDLAAVVLGSDN